MIKCEKKNCAGEMKLERKAHNTYHWDNIYKCKKCGYERLPTIQEREEFQ